MRRRRALALAVGALVVGLAGLALARPGGGNTYSGGGGGGHGGGHGGGGLELVYLLIRLIFFYPQIGIPLLIIVIVAYVVTSRKRAASAQSWDSVAVVAPRPAAPTSFAPLRALDPEFSRVLFDDFVYRLVAQAHLAAGKGNVTELAPYLDEDVRTGLLARAAGAPTSAVVVGSLRLTSLEVPAAAAADGAPGFCRLGLELELNLTSPKQTLYVREAWRLARAAEARSKPPRTTRTFDCPNCGAAFASSDGHTCAYCSQVVDNGRFDWVVTRVGVLESKPHPPSLIGTVDEQGTDWPTIVDPALPARLEALRADDPAFTEAALLERVKLIFTELTAGWNARQLERARPFVSDGMFDYMRYWLEAYARQHLENHNDEATPGACALARLERDAHYDALTVRLWATGCDYTVDQQLGRVVGGSKSRPRAYSEYWTLIRAAARRGAPSSDKKCPNCGAELKISMAGDCAYCKVHVTAGEFDWVLSKIEQDDSYGG